MTKHSPFLAVILSMILVGTGQLYNGQNAKGKMLALFFWVSVLLPLLSLNVIIAPIIYVLALVDSYRFAKGIVNQNISYMDKNSISFRLTKA